MRMHGIMIVLALSSHGLLAQDEPFYQPPGGSKPSAAKYNEARAVDMTMETVQALNLDKPGQALIEDIDWVVVKTSAWQNQEQVAHLATFIQARVRFAGVWSALESKILVQSLGAMMERPPGPGTTALRRVLREFYLHGYLVDDLTALAQRRSICEILHPMYGTEVDAVPFALSQAARRFERRERHLQATGAPSSPVPVPPQPANSF
jgi:hypothetical protein